MRMLIFVIVSVVIVIVSVLIIVVVGMVIIIMTVLIFVIVGVIIVIVRMPVFIGVLIIFMHMPGSANWNNLDASRYFHDWHIFRRAFYHLKQAFFKASAIDEDQISLRQRREIARARLETVRVSAGRNQRREFNVISRNVVDDIRKNTVGSDHFELVFLRDRIDIWQQKGRKNGEYQGDSLLHFESLLHILLIRGLIIVSFDRFATPF